MIVKIPEEFDSKFRFILVAAERARQIQNGASPTIDVESRKPSYVAIKEVEQSRVPYKILEENEENEEDEEP